jgi:thioesterase domain-containing protein
VARKLAGEGEEIGVLALFDTRNPAYYRHLPPAKSMRFLIDTIAVRSKKYIRGFTNGDMAAIATYLREFFKRKWDAFFWNMNRWISRVAGRPMPKAMRDNVRMFDAVGTVYAPKFFSGKLILFRAEDRTAEYRHDPALGWDAVAQGGVDVLRVQGDHITIMEKPNVVDLVRQLSPLLNRADVQKGNSSAWSSSPPQRPAYYAENVTKSFADVDNRRTNLRMNIP